MTAITIYKGQLRCESRHLQSGTIIETDAPTDNKGKGERFSPTDLLCVSLGTCIVTTMGIKAMDMNVDLTNTNLEITKIMFQDPRRVGKVVVKITIPANEISDKDKIILERVGLTCPVSRSLHPDIEQDISFNWQ